MKTIVKKTLHAVSTNDGKTFIGEVNFMPRCFQDDQECWHVRVSAAEGGFDLTVLSHRIVDSILPDREVFVVVAPGEDQAVFDDEEGARRFAALPADEEQKFGWLGRTEQDVNSFEPEA